MVHLGNAGSWAAVVSLDPIFDGLFAAFGSNDRYFTCHVGSEFCQSSRLMKPQTSGMTDPFPKITRLSKLLFKKPIVSCYRAMGPIDLSSDDKLILYGYKPRSLCKIRHKVVAWWAVLENAAESAESFTTEEWMAAIFSTNIWSIWRLRFLE